MVMQARIAAVSEALEAQRAGLDAADVRRGAVRIETQIRLVHEVLAACVSADPAVQRALCEMRWGTGEGGTKIHRAGCVGAGSGLPHEYRAAEAEHGVEIDVCLAGHEAAISEILALWEHTRGGMFCVLSHLTTESSVEDRQLLHYWSRVREIPELAVLRAASWPYILAAASRVCASAPGSGSSEGERLVMGYTEQGSLYAPIIESYAHALRDGRIVWMREGWVCYRVDEERAREMRALIESYAVTPEVAVLPAGAGLEAVEVCYALRTSGGWYDFAAACEVASGCTVSV